jgi:dihydroceramidase
MTGGYWGQPTSTIDWCEANYETTTYIAEFWNTISNLIMIILPMYGIYWSITMNRRCNGRRRAGTLNINKSIIACHVALLAVGVGSWLFHMTLKYSMQLLDEIPMIWAISTMCYANYELIETINSLTVTTMTRQDMERRRRRNHLVLVALVSLSIAITYLYMFHLTNPIFHEICYAIIHITVIAQSTIIVRKLRISPRLYLVSVVYIAIGFTLWNIDNQFCWLLKRYRASIDASLPKASSITALAINVGLIMARATSELHSWWHLFAGYSAYLGIINTVNILERTTLVAQQQQQTEGNTNNTVASKLTRSAVRPIKSSFFNLIYNLNGGYLNASKDNV